MKPIPNNKRLKILGLYEMKMMSLKEIAERVGCAQTTVHYVVKSNERRQKLLDPETPLTRFHTFEKKVNEIKSPELVLGEAPPLDLIDLYRTAKNAFDMYMAVLGSTALTLTEGKEEED